MAVINNIRKRSGLILTFVGIGLLAFIIPVDKIMQLFNEEQSGGIGLFDSEEINSQEWNYEFRLMNSQNRARQNSKESGGEGILSDNEEDKILQSVWNQMISEKIHSLEITKLGIGISSGKKGELNLGILNPNNPVNSSLKEAFTENGIYNADSFAVWKRKVIDPLLNTTKGKQDLKAYYEDPLNEERMRYKYLAMLKNGVVGSFQEAKRNHTEENTKANITYVFKNYDAIDDTLVNVSDEDLKNYFNTHRYKTIWNQNQEVRNYDYVIFNISPSLKDQENSMKSLESLKEDFANAGNDSMFVVNNAETPTVNVTPYGNQPTGMYSDRPYSGGKYSADVDAQIDSANKGDVIGPFMVPNQNALQLVKIFDTGEQDEASVRHILIKSSGDGSADDLKKKKLADSILFAVRRDTSKFTDLVLKYSEDPGSSATGGVYKNFPRDQMVTEFNDFSFDKKVGSAGVVKTQFGYHVIEVLNQQVGSYKKIAAVDLNLKVSEETQEEFYANTAVSFYNKAKETSFEEAALEFGVQVKKSGYIPLTYPDGQGNNGAFGPAELKRNLNIVKWAFNSEIGSVMEPEYISNNEQLVICSLTESIHENDMTFNNIKSLMKPKLINELKAKYMQEKLDSIGSLAEVAKKMESTIETADVSYSYVNLKNNYQSVAEPKLMATIFHNEEGITSGVIEGNEGVYVVQVNSKTEAADAGDLTEKTKEATETLRGIVEQWYYYSLYKSYGAKDNRLKRNIIQ
jgi:peptidyl-prolyl cis-trans isomerase D